MIFLNLSEKVCPAYVGSTILEIDTKRYIHQLMIELNLFEKVVLAYVGNTSLDTDTNFFLHQKSYFFDHKTALIAPLFLERL